MGICGYANFNRKIKNNNDITKMALELSEGNSLQTKIIENVALGYGNINKIELLNEHGPAEYIFNGHKYIIIFDGRLKNTNIICEKLNNLGYDIKNNDNTKLITLAYDIFKEKCLNLLDGSYSFVIYDLKNKMIFLARDRLGLKGLYYTIENNTLIFSSQIKSILKHPLVHAKIGTQEILELIGLGPAHTLGNTFFKNIYEIKPGYYATYKNINFNTYCYWDLKSKPFEEDIYTAINKSKKLVIDSLKEDFNSDVPICSMLSGGLDSSVLAVLAKEENSNLSTFSVDFMENSSSFSSNDYQPTQDSKYVKLMSNTLNTNHTNICLNNKHIFNLLEDAMISRDMPGMADIDTSMLAFCREIKKNNFSICLSGECSDEIFAGYPWFYKEKLLKYSSFPWSLSKVSRENIVNKNICSNNEISNYIDEMYFNSTKNIEFISNNEMENNFRKINYLTIKWFMNTLIERTDKMSYTTGLDVRVPFADYKLFEYVYNIPARYKLGLIHSDIPIEKYILRKAFEKDLPKEIIYRKKSPFPKTYSNDYLLLIENKMKEILNNPQSKLKEILDLDYTNQIIQSKGKILKENWFGQLMTYPQTLAYLIQIDMWIKKYNINIEI